MVCRLVGGEVKVVTDTRDLLSRLSAARLAGRPRRPRHQGWSIIVVRVLVGGEAKGADDQGRSIPVVRRLVGEEANDARDSKDVVSRWCAAWLAGRPGTPRMEFHGCAPPPCWRGQGGQ